MNNNRLLWVLYSLCVLFVLSGAVNNGWSRYAMAIPFMGLILWISKSKLKNTGLFYFSIFLIVFSIGVNHTLEKNPLIYPILHNGEVVMLDDGYIGGSGLPVFYSNIENFDPDCADCINPAFETFSKGDSYKVIGVDVSHRDFGVHVNLKTEVGIFNDFAYLSMGDFSQPIISVNKNIQSRWSEVLSMLMYWPMLPVLFNR